MKIYNTLTKLKENLVPLDKNNIKIYVCGLTVYDHPHLGHARCYISFDIIIRFLKFLGYNVTYVRNITDIDDKIIKKSNDLNIDYLDLVSTYIDSMHSDFKALGILPPDYEPRATDHIQGMIDMITTLITKDYAYVAKNSDVYFKTNNFKKYGQLSKKDLLGQLDGKRVEKNKEKLSSHDFVLWKKSKLNEPFWESPWGNGRPGWHIECSAMSSKILGKSIDIHGGGLDLQFPHHENEIAQSECCFEEKYVNYWMHVGYLNINKEKMSKSMGNFTLIKELLKDNNPEVVRYAIISSHYRSSINYSDELIKNSLQSLKRLYSSIRGLDTEFSIQNSSFEKEFIAEMENDFNTPNALSVLFSICHKLQKLQTIEEKNSSGLAGLMVKMASILGILQQCPDSFMKYTVDQNKINEIEALIELRNKARISKDWKTADSLRSDLLKMGVKLEDKDGQTTWSI